MKAVGYGRRSTAEQASNGVSLEVQRRAVERVAEANGWDMMWLADEGISGAVPPESRMRFKAALALLEIGDAQALIFTKVDRASHCTEDFARPIRLSEEQGWRLIVTEMGIDNAIGGSARRARPRTAVPRRQRSQHGLRRLLSRAARPDKPGALPTLPSARARRAQ